MSLVPVLVLVRARSTKICKGNRIDIIDIQNEFWEVSKAQEQPQPPIYRYIGPQIGFISQKIR